MDLFDLDLLTIGLIESLIENLENRNFAFKVPHDKFY